MQKILLFVLCLLTTSNSLATQPLVDQYSDGVRTGYIVAAKGGYLELPSNERIREIRRRDFLLCSAKGGPVGVFKLEAGKLWLTGLSDCGGTKPLQYLYPDLAAPVVAEWLSGTFLTKLAFRCVNDGNQELYAVKQQLTIEKGVVTSLSETTNDISACPNQSGGVEDAL